MKQSVLGGGVRASLLLGADQSTHMLTVVAAVSDQVSRADVEVPRREQLHERVFAGAFKGRLSAAAGGGSAPQLGAGFLDTHDSTVCRTERQPAIAGSPGLTVMPHHVA